MIIEEIRNKIKQGQIIPKPMSDEKFIVSGWGKRRGENALIYLIPNHKNPSKPYQKGINESEFICAYKQLIKNGEITRQWFDNNLVDSAREGGCNFTTLGSIFKLLGIADYERGRYYMIKDV